MVLGVEHVRPRRRLHEPVHVLDVLVHAALGRHELRVHTLRGELPAAPGVRALPYAAARDRDRDLLAIEADRVDARLVVAAAEPLRALFAVPQRAQQRPALAPVGGMEQPAGNGAGPEILAGAFERP